MHLIEKLMDKRRHKVRNKRDIVSFEKSKINSKNQHFQLKFAEYIIETLMF